MKEQNVSQGYQLSLTLNEAENALEGVSHPFVLGEGGMQAWVPNTKSDSGAKHGQVCHSLYVPHSSACTCFDAHIWALNEKGMGMKWEYMSFTMLKRQKHSSSSLTFWHGLAVWV